MAASPLTTDAILGDSGIIADRLERFDHRPQQVEMASQVAAALSGPRHLIVEAGTGVGKSFGYLVPAILAVTDEDDQRRLPRIVISTHTISLQEQLLSKDLPFLNSVIPREFSSVLAKGRRNYISLRRLQLAMQRAASLFHDDEQLAQMAELARWAKSTHDGSQSDLPQVPDGRIWDEVASDHANCLGKKCPTYSACHYYRARRRMHHSQLLIVNHALFFTDLALRRDGASILPDYQAVVFDEAHTVPHAAREYFGQSLGSGQIEYALSRLYNDRNGRGLLVHRRWKGGQQAVARVRAVAQDFFASVEDWLAERPGQNGRVREVGIVQNRLTPVLDELADKLRSFGQRIEDESERHDFLSASRRLQAMAIGVGSWLQQQDASCVHWVERKVTRARAPRISLRAAPVDVGPALRRHLFDEVPSVIMTSATLAVGQQRSFDYFKNLVGLTKCQTKCLGSPFDYQRQVKLVLVDGMPDPTRDPDDYARLSVSVIQRYIDQFNGRTFVLFTSYKMLREVAQAIQRWLVERNLKLYNQADGTPRHRLLESFKEDPHGVLLGTDSFWQGVDVPGDALKCVIITRLPFSVPDHPVLQAQLESIRASGGNPFLDHQVPEAIIKLRQGFGRLIRSADDSGLVVVLDPRVRTKQYGRHFIESLPTCELAYDHAIGSCE